MHPRTDPAPVRSFATAAGTAGTATANDEPNRELSIRLSRQRSAAFGLKEDTVPDFSALGSSDLAATLEKNRTLHTHALPVMETLYDQIINTHSMVVLTDPQGIIVHRLGDDDFLEKANKVALRPGVAWNEACKGTNAIGTAIADRSPTLVHGNEHYLFANHFLTCSAVPIFDPKNNLMGILDVTGDHRSFHKHTMALVRMSAQMIENQVFTAAFQDAVTLHFHSRPEFIGTLMEGIASFSPSGRFLAANRSGLFQLGLPLAALQSHTFSSLFGLPVSAMFDHYRTATSGFLNLCLHSGVRVFGRPELSQAPTHFRQSAAVVRDGCGRDPASPHPAADRAGTNATTQLSSLRYLNTGDPQIGKVIAKLDKVRGHDIPVLILGETGTGKELLAQAIHNDSPRARSAFVAVNCASIPETLIESELFGYEDGAFTGARKKGRIGKIMQANGGSLFLDEIGDMPLSLQARLLRVLQERMVTPLGSTKSIPVNVALICATNRNLREQISRGEFRDDLYYRLNGLVVKLPALRERTDLEAVVGKLLAADEQGIRFEVSPEVMAMFRQHHWPGNFRQLTNLLQTAKLMAGDDLMIRPEHLPDDFIEDIVARGTMPGPVPMPMPAPPDANHEMSQASTRESVKLQELATIAIRKMLAQHDGNVSETARVLGVSRNTIYRKMKAAEQNRAAD